MYICVIEIGRGCMLGYPIEAFERARREVDPDNSFPERMYVVLVCIILFTKKQKREGAVLRRWLKPPRNLRGGVPLYKISDASMSTVTTDIDSTLT